MSGALLSVSQKIQEEQRKLEKICAKVFIVCGILISIASLIDSDAGLFTAWDNYGTAITSPLFFVTGLLIYLRPQWLVMALMLSVVPTMIYQQGVIATAIHFPSTASLYSAMSSGPFLPLLYVVLFITLPKGASTISWIQCAGYYLQFLLNVTWLADPAPSPGREQAEHLLIEVMMSHPIYVVALNYIVKLRERLYAAQQEGFEHKESLLAMMSHEIRNQLQTMLGAIELLELKLKAPEEKRSVVRLQKAATQLQTYLSDLRELTLLENPNFRFEKTSFDLDRLLEDIRDEWQPMAQGKGLQLLLETPPIKVETDEVRLRQIVSNLVSNAVKYTKTGSVRLNASVCHESSDRLVVEVVDTGIGIDEKHIGQLFKPHVRLDNARECCEEGSGLGLTIVERLVASLGGSLHVESRLGQGTRFWVSMPGLVPNRQRDG